MQSEMPAPEIRNRRGQERRSNSRGPAELAQRSQSRNSGREKEKVKVTGPLDSWVEPDLDVPKPSYQDQGAGPYGVLEHMQPLGEAPNAKARGRVKTEGARKSVLGRSSAAPGADARDTPEGSPAPATSMQPTDTLPAPPVVIDDERDGDYAPKMNGKKKERSMRARTAKQKSESASSNTPAADTTKQPVQQPPSASSEQHRLEYEKSKLERVVEAAKARAREVGKPDLAHAVEEVYQQSLTNARLQILLEAILTQQATQDQTREFQGYVKVAKRALKDAKNKARQAPAGNLYQQNSTPQNTAPPFQPPKVTVRPPPTQQTRPEPASAIPSTEVPEATRSKLTLKVKSPAKDSNPRRSANGNMSVSPRKRAGSAGSDSSLTSLTSNEDNGDDMDLDDEPHASTGNAGAGSTRGQSHRVKDHAAERGSLAVAGGATKRSSADAELEEERDRQLAAKKQKMSESTARDFEYQESNVRPAMPAPRSRAARVRDSALAPPSLRLDPNGSRAASTRGSRAASTDVESPLTDLSPAISRQSTPQLPKNPPKTTGKRAKTKQSPEKKHQAANDGMSGPGGGAGRDSPIGDDDNEELSENNDFCEACGGSGYLLCCDGCNRSFHFSCLDPPISDDAKELDEPWYCFVCVGKRPINESPGKHTQGLFAPLISSLKKSNPANFTLPEEVKNYFEGVAADKNGNFTEALTATKTTRGRPGYSDEQPDYYRTRDSKGNLVLCYHCGKTSNGKRAIVTCDHCSQHWHLDCLDPPLANPPALNQNGKKVHDWMCPLHADQELRRVDMMTLSRRTIHVRKPKKPKVVQTAMQRGFRNNGIIEVAEEETDDSESEFYDQEEEDGIVHKLPEKGIKLDFIDKVKNSRVQKIRDISAAYKRARLHPSAPSALKRANFAKRPFNEKQVALQLAQFANNNQDLNLGGDQVENLVGTLIAEAPTEVVNEMMAAEDVEMTKSVSSAIPPSPPSSEQPEQLSAELRKELQVLQELIRRKLEGSKT
ncbi:Curved DNA-binding [Lecanosticta acicola]|uniref:Curved DNA-binding n=1 Tax=Lecanosticta acicola TaxID=111012 RepID=A0AAI8YUY6_9PEZI|nr:Curved DNA-binding [Lecanosticta acicola]